MENPFEGIIFDLDGTLLNTLDDLADSLNTVLEEAGFPGHSLEACALMVGDGQRKLVERALPESQRKPEIIEAFNAKYSEQYQAQQLNKTLPYPGILHLLAALGERGLKMAVLTNKDQAPTLAVVENFFPNIFTVITGLGPGISPKPNPDGALATARKLGLEPGKLILVGDSEVDMLTARAAGFLAVGVTWGYRSREELSEAGAEIILNHPADFLEMLTALEEDTPPVEPVPTRPPLNKLELGRLVTTPPAYALLKNQEIVQKLQTQPGRPRVALTGGVASGKSTVAKIFEELGAAHIDCDLLARRVVEPGSEGLAQVVELLGQNVLKQDGTLDRGRVGEAVFEDPDLRIKLESIIHPVVWELLGQELDHYEDRPVVVSVPLLFEAGLEIFFSKIVLIFTSPETQLTRLMTRQPELSTAQARNIIDSQWPSPPKVMGSTVVINNGEDQDQTRRQAEAAWVILMED